MNDLTSRLRISETPVKRILFGFLLASGAAACSGTKLPPLEIPTQTASRRNINVTAEATGRIEPIQVIDIKSKAGGQITKMFVESGTEVKKGDTIVILDKRDVQAAFQQADANLKSAQARLDNSRANLKQNEQLFAAEALTRREYENSKLDVTNQETAVISSTQNLELAKQRLEDAVILAPSDGTIIEKIVSEGTVIASASNSASGGTTLVRMANLSRVRARIYVSETDIGKVELNMETRVLVDAYPNKPFLGVVEKREPQAIVDQNVTMFPVIVSLDNAERALMPGMNGEVQIQVDEKVGVLSIPLDAFRLANEARTVAAMFDITPEAVDSINRVGGQAARMGGGINFGDDNASGQPVPLGRGGQAGGEAAGALNGSGDAANRGGGQNGGQGGATGGAGRSGNQTRGNLPEVTDASCAALTAAVAKKPGLQKQIDDLRAQRGPEVQQQVAAAYTAAGINSGEASACRMRETMAAGGGRAGAGGGGRGTRGPGAGGRRGGGAGGAALGNLGQRNGGLGVRGQGLASQGIVFVKVGEDTTVTPPKPKFEARYVQLGAQNYDFAEVTYGLKEGDTVAMLAAARIAIQRQQAADRQKANSGLIPGVGGNAGRGPGMGGDMGGGRGGGGGPGGGGGGARGGGGRGN